MSETAWEDVVELPDEMAERFLEEAGEVQDLTGEVCPYPQVGANKATQGVSTGEWQVQNTEAVPREANDPEGVGDLADAKIWKSGHGFSRGFLHRQ